MKKLLSILVVLIFICAVFIASVQAESLTEQNENEPGITITIAPIFTKLDFIVNIPDPNLKAALHEKTGVPEGHNILGGDLKALTGALSFQGLGIANIEGIQYCENVTSLSFNINLISTLPPNLYRLSKLKSLTLTDNNFTEVPTAVGTIPKLETLIMDRNPISSVDPVVAHISRLRLLNLSHCALTAFPVEVLNPNIESLILGQNDLGSVPGEISNMTSLESLGLYDTGISSLPSTLFDMTWLKILQVSSNKLNSLPSAVSGMSSLFSLHISNNRLEHLPEQICNMTKLSSLSAVGNRLTDLPENIGTCSITSLDISDNHITQLPSSIGAGNLNYLNATANRLTSLPSSFGSNSFNMCYIDYNFIDISPGSPARIVIDSLPQQDFFWQPQLMPVTNLTATPTDTDITLSWDTCIGGTDIGYGDIQTDWSVISYSVYLNENGMVHMAELTPSQTTYAHGGLGPLQSHTYSVAVTYELLHPSGYGDTFNTGYSEVSSQTLPAPTPPPTAPPTAVPTSGSSVSEAANEEMNGGAAEVNGSAANGTAQTALPAWAIVLISIAGAGVLGTGGWFGWRLLKKLRVSKP